MNTTKSVLITGGSRGIGLATAEMLLEKNYAVILIARGQEELAAVKHRLVQAGYRETNIELLALDLANTDAIKSQVGGLKLLQNGLFGLVNNAAVEILKPVNDYTLDDAEATWRVNMLAPLRMMQVCHRYLKQGGGSIVNVSSVADTDHFERYALYGASKAFLRELSLHAAKELGRDGIRINVVSPGGIDTPLMQSMIEKGVFTAKDIEDAKKMIPLEQRWGTPREVAETICFALTGPRYLHGADLRIHGGYE